MELSKKHFKYYINNETNFDWVLEKQRIFQKESCSSHTQTLYYLSILAWRTDYFSRR